MRSDEEMLFGRVRDEIDSSYERAALLTLGLTEPSVPDELGLALGMFELHGATLRTLSRWYPKEACVRDALRGWELLSFSLESKALSTPT